MTRLVEATDADFAALIAGEMPGGVAVADGGIETNDVLEMLRALANDVARQFSPASWLIIDDGCIVGMCSLLAAPDSGRSISIGYGIAPAYRGQGIGKCAIAALAEWARGHPQISSIAAETALTNGPSQGVLLQNGFVKCGERHDPEDGALFCWRLDTHG